MKEGKEPKVVIHQDSGGLPKYLEAENENAESARTHLDIEFRLACDVDNQLRCFTAMVKLPRKELLRPAELLLVAERAFCGAVSQLLRARVRDAQALIRQSIEAAAYAYFLFKNSSLIPIYESAYSRVADIADPAQWVPSSEFNNAFKTKELFRWEGKIWVRLKKLYGVYSAAGVHAGIASLTDHERSEKQTYLGFFETDPKEILRNWYSLLSVHIDILSIFLEIFRDCVDKASLRVLEAELVSLKDRILASKMERAPWMVIDQEEPSTSN